MDYINSFPGYEFIPCGEDGRSHNVYRGTDVGFGGYIISNPGIYSNVALLDIQSLHPSSIIAMNCFGEYTQHFKDILDARVAIKHKDYDKARKMLNGRLAPYLDDESTAKNLAQALKIAINSVYGLTAANFDNPFRDVRNRNNIVALRGALFMRTLQDEVERRGFKIVAIKTDSIKIANATKDIVDFCIDFASKYGYIFEFEACYDRICQINDADYVAMYKDPEWCKHTFGVVPGDNDKHGGKWTVIGAQFAVPYVFKTLFSKEPIQFEDMCETKEVKTSLYLDMNEGLPDVTEWEELKDYRLKFPDWTITGFEKSNRAAKMLDQYKDISDEELNNRISEGHNYIFIGKVSSFCPIKPGCGGGELLREGTDKDGNIKYSAATGSKGYRWLESEMIKELGKEDDIDRSYYTKLVDDAVEKISEYGDFEWFVSDDPVINHEDPPLEEPPWLMACGRETCMGCEQFVNDQFHMECALGHDISDLIAVNENALPY